MLAIYVTIIILLQFSYCFSTSESALQAHLLKNYSIHERPIIDKQRPIKVTIGIELIQIMKFAEDKQEITIKCWLRLSWYNELMTWDPKKFGQVEITRLSRHYVWTPDIYMHGGLGSTISSGPKMYNTVIRLQPSGLHSWFVPVLLPLSCAVDLREFPFDHQSCYLKFGSWTNNQKLLDLKIEQKPILSEKYHKSFLWDLKDVEREIELRKSPGSSTSFVDAKYTLRLVRLHDYYMITVIGPSIVQMICIFATFFFPPDCGERITSVVTVFVVFGFFLSYLNKILPRSSNNTPLLSRFLMTLTIESACALLANIIVLLVHFKVMEKRTRPIPDWVKIYILNYFVKYFGMQQNVLSRIEHSIDDREHYSDSDTDGEGFTVDGRTYTMKIRGIEKQGLECVDRRFRKLVALNEEERMFFYENQFQLEILNDEVCRMTGQLHKMNEREENGEEWHVLVRLLDRVFAVLCFFIFSATLAVFWVIPSINFRA